jgi:hypothetical protein
MYWVCKMCGRAVRQEDKPNYCYFDRMNSIENISDEDAVKMGLDIPEGGCFEFPGDVRWDPDTGDPAGMVNLLGKKLRTLEDFQRSVMARVRQ